MSRILLVSALLLWSSACAPASDPVGDDHRASRPDPPKVPPPKIHAPPEPLRTEVYGRALDAPGDALDVSVDGGGGLWLTSTEGLFFRPADERFFLSLPGDHRTVGGLGAGLAAASGGEGAAVLIRHRSDQRLTSSPFPALDPQSLRIRSFEVGGSRRTFAASGASVLSLDPQGRVEETGTLPVPVEASALALTQGTARALWVGTRVGVFRLAIDEAGRFASHFQEPLDLVADRDDDVVDLDGCADGSVWISALGHGVFHLRADGTLLEHLGREDVLPQDHILSIACDLDGSVWMGTSWGGLVRRLPDGSFRYHNRTAGLPGDSIRRLVIQEVPQGGRILWIATEAGLVSHSES